MAFIRLQGQRLNYNIDNFVGKAGQVYYNPDDGIFRLSDGSTPGGISLGSGGGDGSGYILPTATASIKGGVKIDGTTIAINNQVISVLNGVFTTASYNNPDWITGLAYDKLTGAPSIPTNTNELTNGAGFITSSALTGLATESFVTTRGFLTDIPEATDSIKGGIKLGRGLTKDANGIVDAFSGSYNDLTDRPTIPTDINQLTDNSGLLGGGGGGSYTLPAATESTLGGIKIGSGLSIDGSGVVSVTVSGVTSYNELTDRPTIPSDVSDLTDTGNLLFDGSYNSLSDTPTIPEDVSDLTDTQGLLGGGGGDYSLPIASTTVLGGIKVGEGLSINGSGALRVTTLAVTSYNELTDTPDLSVYQLSANAFSGSYSDLTNRPTIPADISDLTDTTSLLFSKSYNDLTNLPSLFSGSYADLTNKPTIPTNNTELTNGAGYITAASLVGYATETYVTTRGYLTSVDYSIISNVPTFATVATSGSYNDLSNKPYIPDVGILTFEASTVDTADSSGINFTPLVTFNSDVIVENDIVVSNVIRTVTGEIFATQAFVRQEVSNLVGSAPSALDTLQELAAALGNDENFATTVLNAITTADNAVRFDTASQNLTEPQKQNARTNIDAVSAADVYAAAIVMG